MSLAAQRRVLVLHSMLTLREIQETAGKHDVDRVMHMLGWLPANGLAAQEAYTRGFLDGQKRFLPVAERVQRLARALLADSDVARNLAANLGMTVAESCVVVVVRVPFAVGERAQFVNALLKRHYVPMTWHEQCELVAVVPDASRGLLLVQDFAQLLERPCAVGAATGRLGALGDAAALARRVSRVAPVERMPGRLPAVDDLFVEFAVAQTPEIGNRLRELAQRLATGPDLIATLAAYYQHDMNRMNTAGALRIHPRTLDYRLRRVRTLVGIDPASTRGVRTLSTTVACVQAGLWD